MCGYAALGDALAAEPLSRSDGWAVPDSTRRILRRRIWQAAAIVAAFLLSLLLSAHGGPAAPICYPLEPVANATMACGGRASLAAGASCTVCMHVRAPTARVTGCCRSCARRACGQLETSLAACADCC